MPNASLLVADPKEHEITMASLLVADPKEHEITMASLLVADPKEHEITMASLLVVDDDPAIRALLQAGLGSDGYHLKFASNGAEAITQLGEGFPDVVILDLNMPVMNGLEFLSKIQLEPVRPYSVVVLTGFDDEKSVETCYRAGVSSVVKKPFTLNKLRVAVRHSIMTKDQATHTSGLLKFLCWTTQDDPPANLPANSQNYSGATKPCGTAWGDWQPKWV